MEMAELVRLRMAIGRLGRVLRQQTDDGLTYPQISLLFSIERAQPVTARELAESEGVSAPSVTRSFNYLARVGLVTREPAPNDGRAFLIRLTSAGEQECLRLRRSRDIWLSEHLDGLSSDDVHLLLAALPALERLCDPALPSALHINTVD